MPGQHSGTNNSPRSHLNQVMAPQHLAQLRPTNIKTTNTFARETQGQQSLRLMQNQMMAPSMPNIAHSSGYATNIHSANSQSMQNVNTAVQPPMNFQKSQYVPGYVGPPEHSQPLRMNAGVVGRVNQVQKPIHATSMEHVSAYPTGYSGPLHHPQQKQNTQIMSQQQHQQVFVQNMTMSSPIKSQTPLPEIKSLKHPADTMETPPLPPTSTHPLYKTSQSNFNYVASTNEPPKVGLYPSQSASQVSAGKQIIPSAGNPWEREEREKEQEIRRGQVRVWRDKQINDLSNIPNRNLQQEEQLKTLLLERDFERRAIEEQAEEENEEKYAKDNVQEVLRLANQTRKTVEICATSSNNILASTGDTATNSTTAKLTHIGDHKSVSPTTMQIPTQNINANIQPKSILKHNIAGSPASPSKQQNKTATFIDKSLNLTEITMNNTNANQMMSQMNKLSLNEEFETQSPGSASHYHQNENNNDVIPPPPPERNSSYLIMAQQQKFRSQQQNVMNNNNIMPKQSPGNFLHHNNNPNTKNSLSNNSKVVQAEVGFVQSPNTTNICNTKIDNKRVSFHDEDNGNIVANTMTPETPVIPNTYVDSDNSGIEQAELAIIREDPNVSQDSRNRCYFSLI